MIRMRLIGANRVQADLKEIGDSILTKRIMGQIGAAAIEEINKRTGNGVDADNRRFEPYTPKYKKFKQKLEARFFTGKVNLSVSGNMLSAMQWKATDKKATIFFNKPKEALKASGNDRKRHFFAVNQKDMTIFSRIIERHIK